MARNKKLVSLALALTMGISMGQTAFAATTSPVQSQREKRNAALARKIAAQGMVLLAQNADKALPIKQDKRAIALFGNGAIRTIRGGTGSGDPFNGGLSGGGDPLVNQSERYHVNIYDTFVREGYKVTNGSFLEDWAKGYDKELSKGTSDPMATFAYPEMNLTETTVKDSAKDTDTAIYVISRNAGEGAEREKTTKQITLSDGTTIEAGDYELTDVEKENLKLVGKNFDKVVVVLNIGGVIDTKFFEEIEGLDSLLLMGQAGQEAGDALYDVVTGEVTPSGKLTSTWAKNYNDYPASDTFANNDNNVDKEVYNEGIYVGYRYFDTFGITPKYEFGYGLSYTNFDIKVKEVKADADKVTVKVNVKNVGDTYSGKEVVQLYYSCPNVNVSEKEYQELGAYAKTDILAPGENQVLEMSYNTKDMAYYNEEKAEYILEGGEYILRVGNSSRNTSVAAVVELNKDVVTEKLSNQMPVPENESFKELSRDGKNSYSYEGEHHEFATAERILIQSSDFKEAINNASPYDDEKVNTYTTNENAVKTQDYENIVKVNDKKGSTLLDVYNKKVTMEEFISQMSLEQMATLNCGSGWGVSSDNSPVVGSNSDTIPGAAGETTTKYIKDLGIPSIVLADGPGGIRVNQHYTATNVNTGEKEELYQYCTSWPVSMLCAQTWDVELLKEIGQAMASELDELGITLILGPGLNIHRDPLCGRNFEYYSEDPLISGTMAAATTLGIQSVPGVGACLKHFAGNNQETNRNAVDTIASERALREIYLKGFEIAVKSSQPMSIMTSYNKINNIPTADDYNLCTDILRGEWKFDGLVMTDWNGGSSTPLKSMHAGNDLIMPGGATKIQNIIGGLTDLKPVFDDRGQIDLLEVKSFVTMQSANWGEFKLSPEGKNTETAKLADGYKASVTKEGKILVNDKPIYTNYQFNWGAPGTWNTELTTDYAKVSEDGKEITYFGDYPDNNEITLGDVQKSAINNLKIIMKSIAMKKLYPEVTITPYSSNYELASYNYVNKGAVYRNAKVFLNKSDIFLELGQSETLEAIIEQNDSSETLTWLSSDVSVAEVDESGKVTGKGNGDAIITVTLTNGDYATCIVRVRDIAHEYEPEEEHVIKLYGDPTEKENPTSNTNSNNSNEAKTGDKLPIFPIALMTLSATGLVVLLKKKRYAEKF